MDYRIGLAKFSLPGIINASRQNQRRVTELVRELSNGQSRENTVAALYVLHEQGVSGFDRWEST